MNTIKVTTCTIVASLLVLPVEGGHGLAHPHSARSGDRPADAQMQAQAQELAKRRRAIFWLLVLVVLVALLVAITLVPALLSLMTRWVSRRGMLARLPLVGGIAHTFGDAPPAEGFFSRLAARVQQHPWLVAITVTAVLVVLALLALRRKGSLWPGQETPR